MSRMRPELSSRNDWNTPNEFNGLPQSFFSKNNLEKYGSSEGRWNAEHQKYESERRINAKLIYTNPQNVVEKGSFTHFVAGG